MGCGWGGGVCGDVFILQIKVLSLSQFYDYNNKIKFNNIVVTYLFSSLYFISPL